jgi:DNA-damage-inducible protein J
MARLQYTVPDERKNLAEKILEAQGLTPQVVINMLYVEIVNRGGIPFEPSQVKVPNELTAKTNWDADRGIDIVESENLDDMFNKLNDE